MLFESGTQGREVTTRLRNIPLAVHLAIMTKNNKSKSRPRSHGWSVSH